MSNSIIKVENLSKKYIIGHQRAERYTALRDVLASNVKGILRKTKQLVKGNFEAEGDEMEEFWALRDVNFEINRGDRVGIVGRNGAGKSTLLKVLSRITEPSTGKITIDGRVASLLEVGTGFHPELSGRENVYLNGAILGMSRQEIKKKFDEIVAFAEVEKFLDTPVKRYSSGMYVRLAFAVAAHLEPEILIVDEVLAVGDAQFQKKCLGKMQDVSAQDGRTVLFVSHNMTAIKNLCNTAIYMRQGSVIESGPTDQIINNYLSNYTNGTLGQFYDDPADAPGNEFVRLKRIEVVPKLNDKTDNITVETPIDIEFEFWNEVTDKDINLSLVFNTIADECVFNVGTPAMKLSKGLHKGVCHIPGNLLNDGIYKISMMVVGERSYSLHYFVDAVSLEVHEARDVSGWHGKWIGFVRPQMDFTLS